ncbi:DUF1028 domain-containing protein [Arthrobacter russicus]|jgi:uncharacterized Ntn-hydrolase superfamily protein|uniref:Ntn-hydrolase superfamily protein n=1 Tax=Arthrobacter russicus TaxID=172040 RepID=A0ABU1J6H4_9MICC|nr:DUF1028 domain-containing protein [Arthrobacter russicus]MDR6268017.1 putative Ntn-hydrolase superfamily protein [Arthrobacter russicus]
MTFSIAATDGAGRFGLAVASSSPAVAARCAHLRDGVGVVSSQNITDPRLGPELLDQMQAGASARQALDAVVRETPWADFRQLVVLDSSGRGAAFNGTGTLGNFGDARGAHSVAAGNMLATSTLPQVLCETFEAAGGELEERLLAALQAAESAGGEAGPVHSAGISVVSGHGWRDTDLRVDWHEQPIAELDRLLRLWLPQRQDYVVRALDPAASIGYGVPGDDR